MGELGANTSKPPLQQDKGAPLGALETKGIETLINASNNPITGPAVNLGLMLAKLLDDKVKGTGKSDFKIANTPGASGQAAPNQQQWFDAFQQR